MSSQKSGFVPMDDDVTSFPADAARLRSFDTARQALAELSVPRLVDPAQPHQKLFIAAFDGTGNDKAQDSIRATNISRLDDQFGSLSKTDAQVYVRYLPGPGTQRNPLTRTADLALGFTYQAKLEEMYDDLTAKANEWYQADPNVQIRVLSTGFSRGGSQAAGFTNLLHERGIIDLDSEVIGSDGRSRFTRHIAAPGQTLQAVGLFDPVATGMPERFERHLAPSVVSGLQITSLDDLRGRFLSDALMAPGRSPDGRFLNVAVAGAHSDVGGSYLRDGLSRRSFNLMADYVNALRPGAPLLAKLHEPDEPRLNVVHRSHEALALYQVDRQVDRATPAGRTEPAHAPRPLAQRHGLPMATPKIAPVPPPGEENRLNLRRLGAAQAQGLGPLPGSTRLAHTFLRGAGLATATGLTVQEVVQTVRRTAELREQGNPEGARSELQHTLARNAGGWVGGASAAYLAGTSGYWPAALVVADALLMSKAFDKAVDLAEHRRIYRQTDRDGVVWQFSGRNWERTRSVDASDDGIDNPRAQTVGAHYEKARELNARASRTAVELALRQAPPPQNPFHLPARDSDRIGLDNRPWQYDPDSGHWARQVKSALHGTSERGVYHTQQASPERARELDQQARARIDQNIAQGREAIAATYLERHAAQRAGQFVDIPPAVQVARARPDAVLGSDQRLYQRGADGQWLSQGQPAQGNLARELEWTWQQRQPVLERFAHTMAELAARAPLTAGQVAQNELLHRYQSVGVVLAPEWQQAIAQATQHTRQRHGISGASLQQVLRGESGYFGADSPVAHYQTGADGVARRVAITTSEELRLAWNQVRQGLAASIPTLDTVAVAAPLRIAPEPVTERPAPPSPSRPGPAHPEHPDHALLGQIRAGVRRLGQASGAPAGEAEERLCRSLLAACKEGGPRPPGITRADHVLAGGEHVFVVEGRLDDPAHQRVHVHAAQAMNTPLAQSDAQVQAAGLVRERLHEQAQQQAREQTQARGMRH